MPRRSPPCSPYSSEAGAAEKMSGGMLGKRLDSMTTKSFLLLTHRRNEMRRTWYGLTAVGILLSLATLVFATPLRAQADAGKIFKTNCVLCHAADGSGNSPTGKALKAKDLKSEEVQKVSDTDLAAVITSGKGKMPAFGKKLKPEDITALVQYVRGLAKK
jgi:cytochrome c6